MQNDFLTRFAASAAKWRIAIEEGKAGPANKLFKRLSPMFWQAKEAGQLAIFLSCLDYPDVGVQYWAAVFLLSTHPEPSVTKLQELTEHKSILAMSATMGLDAYAKGRLFHQ